MLRSLQNPCCNSSNKNIEVSHDLAVVDTAWASSLLLFLLGGGGAAKSDGET